MKIKALDRFKHLRKAVIPGKITIEQYRSLQAGEVAEVDQASADFLISRKYAEIAKETVKPKTVKKDEGGDS